MAKLPKPKLEEVQAYCQEKGFTTFTPEEFFYYYEANGWTQGGRKPIVNWKMAASGWDARKRAENKQKQTTSFENFDNIKY